MKRVILVNLVWLSALGLAPSAAAPQTVTLIGMAIDATEMNRRLVQLAERPDSRFWRVDYETLSAPERVFRSVWELEAEVNNGGFHQYFLNSSGSLVPLAPGALRAIGAFATAAIVENAVAAVGSDVPWLDEAARQDRINAIEPEQFERFDDAFYAYPDNLTVLLYRFVSAHGREIGVPSDF